MFGDPLILSRLQFAFVIASHIIFPAFTVGLASYIAVLEGLYLARGDARCLRASKFLLRIFAVAFGMGVVSGIVMPFQFGTNWARLSDQVANVVGPLLAYEGLTAFFLEATFLGVLLFGRGRVPQWAHFGAAVLVAVGTLFSSFWILAFNSWLQTPAGFVMEGGRFMPSSFSAILFNPSFPYRLAHTVSAFYNTTGFVVLGVSAYYLARGRHRETALLMARMTVFFLAVMMPLQILLGDAHGLNTLQHQPAKIAAMEGLWETSAPASSVLFAIPDQGRAGQSFRSRSAAIGQPVSDSFPGWPSDRPQGVCARRSAAGIADLLRVSGDGGHRHADAAGRLVGGMAGLARQIGTFATLFANRAMDGSQRLYRRVGGLGRHGDGSATLDRLRFATHRREREPNPDRLGRVSVAVVLSGCLSHGVRGGWILSAATDPAGS
jgi:hypothetical protein